MVDLKTLLDDEEYFEYISKQEMHDTWAGDFGKTQMGEIDYEKTMSWFSPKQEVMD